MTDPNESAFDVCDACGGDGEFCDTYIDYDHTVRSDFAKCKHCGGTGYIEREAQAVESFEEWNEAVGYDEETQWW